MASAVPSGVLFVRASRTIVISSCHRSQNVGGGYRKNFCFPFPCSLCDTRRLARHHLRIVSSTALFAKLIPISYSRDCSHLSINQSPGIAIPPTWTVQATTWTWMICSETQNMSTYRRSTQRRLSKGSTADSTSLRLLAVASKWAGASLLP